MDNIGKGDNCVEVRNARKKQTTFARPFREGFGRLAFAVGVVLIGGLGLGLINMDERIAVETRYFVVDPTTALAAPQPRIGYPMDITHPPSG